MLHEHELIKRIVKAGAIRRWYQNVPYCGIILSQLTKYHFADGKTNKNSYGQGRWKNYITPMINRIIDDLDTHNATMCEIGCSAGLFLLLGWQQYGFRRLIGVEAADGAYEQLLITRDYYDELPLLTYKVSVGKAEKNIFNPKTPRLNMETFPIVDLTLMSCVHYHIEATDLFEYLEQLASKSMYLLVVTDARGTDVCNSSPAYFKELMNNFEGWEFLDEKQTPAEWLAEKRTDRYKDLTAMLYKSTLLKRLDVAECFEKQLNHSDYNKAFYGSVFPPFVRMVLRGIITKDNYADSLVYKWQTSGYHGSTAWPEKIAAERTLSYMNMIHGINEHGQEQPIVVQEHVGMVDPWDGLHRVAVLKHFGIKYVYGKDIILECSDQT